MKKLKCFINKQLNEQTNETIFNPIINGISKSKRTNWINAKSFAPNVVRKVIQDIIDNGFMNENDIYVSAFQQQMGDGIYKSYQIKFKKHYTEELKLFLQKNKNLSWKNSPAFISPWWWRFYYFKNFSESGSGKSSWIIDILKKG